MIEISDRAQQHFRHLLEEQGDEGTGILIRVSEAGTPAARCDLEFCEPEDLNGTELALDTQGFVLYVEQGSRAWLEEASIDYEEQRGGGRLNIRAPKIRGEAPAADAALMARVQHVIDGEINPQLASHGGRVALVDIDGAGVAVLQFGGGCHGCGMADVTLKQGVEKTLRIRVPEITGVRDATDHDSGQKPYYAGHQGRSAMQP